MPNRYMRIGRYSESFRRNHYVNQQYNALRRFLTLWPWEWYLTLQFSTRFDRQIQRVHKTVIEFIRAIAIGERLQIGGIYVLSAVYGHPHVHMLALGRTSSPRPVQSLADVRQEHWESDWAFRVRDRRISMIRAARIQPPIEISDVARYIAGHILPYRSTWAEIVPYNIRLLINLQRESDPEGLRPETQSLIRQISPQMASNLGLND